MTEFTMDRLRENLESLKMKNTLEILDNYLERAVAENLNIVDVLDHIFAEEAKSKRAWQKILCKRYSTKSRMALRKQGGIWRIIPWRPYARERAAVCAPQA